MQTDEEQIRALVATWMSATKAGDVDTILGLMTDDAVFLIPGRPPMLKEEFASQARSQALAGAPSIDGVSEIQEISVSGDLAFARAKLHVTVSPSGGAAVERAGHTLTVFRKQQGKWRLARDANLLAPVAKP